MTISAFAEVGGDLGLHSVGRIHLISGFLAGTYCGRANGIMEGTVVGTGILAGRG